MNSVPLREKIVILGVPFWYRLVPDPVQVQSDYTWYTVFNILNYAELGSVAEHVWNVGLFSSSEWVASMGDTKQSCYCQEQAVAWVVTRFALEHYINSSTPRPKEEQTK